MRLPMKLRYFSDVHLECMNPTQVERFIQNIPHGMDEVCILAGDIGNPYQSRYHDFMEYISQHFKKAFVILGNHEYYFHPIEKTNAFLASYFQTFDNISLLNNSCEIYEGCCFVGTTLWSQVTNPAYKINDVYNIPSFDYIQCNRMNRMCVDFLEEALNHEKCVVITHHMPSSTLIDVKYLTPTMRPYNQWFYCDLDQLIDSKKDNIKAWFYGHTHTPATTVFHGIPFLCNSIGYPNENTEIGLLKGIDL